MTQTQEIINHRVSKFMNGYEGMCMSRGKFSKPGQVRGKLLSQFCPTFMNDSNSKYNNLYGFDILKFYKWILGDVYDWGKVS